MFNIKNLFKKNKDNRKDKLLGHLKEDNALESEFVVDVTEEFIEQPTDFKAQYKKAHISFLEFIENTKTFLVPNELFIIEVLDESVSVGIISKKAIFLDIKYLKKYTYEELHQSYQKIINKEVEYDRSWYESIENIITIVSYDTIYSLPRKIVIVDNRHTDFVKASVTKGRFKDKQLIDNFIKKEFEMSSGYKMDETYTQVTQRPLKEETEKTIYVISMVEKDYFDTLNQYFHDSDFVIKRFHSIKSSLYSSFFVQDKNSKMRIHVVDNIAYVMEKHKESGFEYQQFNLEIDMTGIEVVSYAMDEVIISGSGEYYDKLKALLVDSKIKLRTFNYLKDLNRSIIRLEEGVILDNSFATVVGIAYHELFKINFSSIRLGISKNMTIYEIMYNNLNVLPFIILFVVIVSTYGSYAYLQYEYKDLKKKHLGTTKLVNQEKRLKEDISRYQKNIRNTQNKINKLEDLFANKIASPDALILHQLAQKLPDDMIIIKMEKKTIENKLKKNEEVIQVTGKCFHEKSLLQYIRALRIAGKNVFLVSLEDSKKLKFEEEGESKNSIFSQLQKSFNPAQQINNMTGDISGQMQNIANGLNTQTQMLPNMGSGTNQNSAPKSNVTGDMKQQEIQKMNLENKKIYFSDTLNNTFVLEIK